MTKLSAVAALCGACGFASMAATPVALELVLLVDVSGSIDATEYAIQKTGYVNAFQDASIHTEIGNLVGGMAVTYIEWSGANQQSIEVAWTHITDAASANAFATAIAASTRNFSGLTAPGSAINYVASGPGLNTVQNNDFDGARVVIDVSGDGVQNDGASTPNARDAALASGVDRINGLAITTDVATLATWYANNIQGGAGSFTIAANNFAAFENAILAKIKAEITDRPPELPDSGSALVLMALGLGVLVPVLRKSRIA